MRRALTYAICFSALFCGWLGLACSHAHAPAGTEPAGSALTLLSTGQNAADISFLETEFSRFGNKTGFRVKGVAGSDSIDTRLKLLRELFAKKSPEPDICEIDNVWPGLLADDLLDLKPYLGDEMQAIDKTEMETFTVKGRLIALPEFTEGPVLYYRTDLLAKYGFRQPPRTWDELGHMAKVIQDGERKAGIADFWGYLWQGMEGESLNCNAMEWQRSEGANLFDSSGKLCAYSPAAEAAIRRARSWVGTISPPSVIEYDEEDSANAWLAGSAAFVRSWFSLNEPSRTSAILANKFATTAMPAGRAGYAWTFGGMGWAVSRYSAHRKEAIDLIRYLVSAGVQKQRLIASLTVPSRMAFRTDDVLFRDTPFKGWLSQHWQEGVYARPSAITGKKYDAVSRAYSKAIHDAISGKRDTHLALMQLQTDLIAIMR